MNPSTNNRGYRRIEHLFCCCGNRNGHHNTELRT